MVRILVVVLIDHRLVYRASSGGEASLKPVVLCPLHRVFSRSSIIRNYCPFLPTGGGLMNCPVIIQQLGNDTTWLPLTKESFNKSIRILVTKATAMSLESKITKKIVSFNLDKKGFLEHLEDGYQFQWENLSLGILGNRRESEGWYIVSLEENVQVQQFCIQLKLYEQVSTPEIKVLNKTQENGNGTCSLTVVCTVKRGDHVTYSWSNEAGKHLLSLANHSHLLNISLSSQDPDSIYNCTASNPVSSRSQSFDLSQECRRESSGSEAAGKDADSRLVDGILGESVTFPLNIQEPQKVKNIAWTSKSSVAFVKARLQGAPPEVTVTQAVFEGRIDVIEQNYDLIIKGLRMEDAGTYKADINIENIPTTTKHYHLHIYRRLGKPTITQSLITFVNNSCNVTLTCSMEKEEENVTYSWSPFGERSNVLQIFQSPEDQKLNYTCTVQNPVSNNSNSITAQELCTGNEVPKSSTSPKVVNGVRGGSATLLLELPAGKNASVIIWQQRGRESHDIAILIIQLNKSSSPQITRMDPERGKRLNIAQSSSLQISNLTMADEGL
ncbi:Signaling lymphocytic activation molecule [Microtus ochrogaster]|uniref:Signaling lymphocytic activation molecule n=1 Tax=Microtus ochrogaster TaxID=79684 RepID=A0A8J6KWD3_MICOH|nr:Signaling lymphocytic activation molecule [Microtus ochrogaster]